MPLFDTLQILVVILLLCSWISAFFFGAMKILSVRVVRGARTEIVKHMARIKDPAETFRALFQREVVHLAHLCDAEPELELGTVSSNVEHWTASSELLDECIIGCLQDLASSGTPMSLAKFAVHDQRSDPSRLRQTATPVKDSLMAAQAERQSRKFLPPKKDIPDKTDPANKGKIVLGKDVLHNEIIDYLTRLDIGFRHEEVLSPGKRKRDGSTPERGVLFVKNLCEIFFPLGQRELDALSDKLHSGAAYVIHEDLKTFFRHKGEGHKAKTPALHTISQSRENLKSFLDWSWFQTDAQFEVLYERLQHLDRYDFSWLCSAWLCLAGLSLPLPASRLWCCA